jgi:hypothetical protein
VLGESAAEGLLEFGCDRIVWIETENDVQLFEGGAKLHQLARRGDVGGVKLGDGGWSIGLARPDFASRTIAQGGLRLRSLVGVALLTLHVAHDRVFVRSTQA